MDGICVYCGKILRDVSKNICEECKENKGRVPMNEIKFRGKRLDSSEWVVGYLVPFNQATYDGRESRWGIRTGIITVFEVDPATVGQYIRREDINEVEVFTGDMVKADLCEPGYQYVAHPYICEVVLEGFAYLLKVIDHADKSRFKLGKVPKISELMKYHCINWAENLTVIGNRWDNPQLLEVRP